MRVQKSCPRGKHIGGEVLTLTSIGNFDSLSSALKIILFRRQPYSPYGSRPPQEDHKPDDGKDRTEPNRLRSYVAMERKAAGREIIRNDDGSVGRYARSKVRDGARPGD